MDAALARLQYGRPAAPDVVVIARNAGPLLADIEAVEARCAGVLSPAEAVDALGTGRSFGLALLDADGLSDDAGVERLFGSLRGGASAGRFAVVALLPEALIDVAVAQLDAAGVTLLVTPSPAERRAAIMAALPDGPALSVFDGGAGAPGADALREEVARIARRLTALAAEPVARAPAAIGNGVDAAAVRGIIRARRLRDQYFDAALFADPAWDMLLDLVAARLEGCDVAVSSLCIAAAVPPTTALRWIKILTDAGMFIRQADPADKRRVFIALADRTADAMTCYLGAAQRAGAAPI